MNKILVPYFEPNGTSTYPVGVITIMTQLTFNDTDYWIGTGEASAETGPDTYADYEKSLEPVEVIVTGITGDLYHAPDFSKAACYQLTDMIVTGTVDIEDRFFAMPVKNTSTGEIVFFGAQVTNKAFSVTINFESSGQYQYTDDEASLDLPSQEYTVNPMKFDVLRKTT